MNPQPEKSPGLQLPQPAVEIGAAGPNFAPERQPLPERGGRETGHTPPVAPIITDVTMTPPVPIATPQITDPPAATSSTQAADDDSLDEEWINKAKAVVNMTLEDPYLQSNELSKVKAEFLKVRYNKDIKVAHN